MATAITKKFWNGTEYKNIAKIVFTSPNFTSPAVAGTRSHMPPGGEYIGTWFEAVDWVYRQKANQNYAIFPGEMESFFGKFTLISGTFDFNTDTNASFYHSYGEDYDVVGAGVYENILYKDKYNYGIIESCISGNTTISGIGTVYTADITFSSVTGSGTLTSSGTDNLTYHQYSNVVVDDATTLPRTRRHHGSNSIIFTNIFGEAYDCRLTAWDDDTHSTTDSKVINEEHYRIDAAVYRSNIEDTAYSPIFRTTSNLVFPPVYDIPLKGDEKYYGDFDLIFSIDVNEYGEYLVFLPRLINMDSSFVAGSYDFITTLHYQYT